MCIYHSQGNTAISDLISRLQKGRDDMSQTSISSQRDDHLQAGQKQISIMHMILVSYCWC